MTKSYSPKTENFIFERKTSLKAYSMSSSHFHNVNEIYYLLNGEKKYFIDNKAYLLKRGSLVFIPAFELHKSANITGQKCEGYLLTFSKDFLELQNPLMDRMINRLCGLNNKCIQFSAHERQIIEDFFKSIQYEKKNKECANTLFIESIVIELIICLYRKSQNINYPKFEHINLLHQKVSEIAQFIESHFNEPISLKSISSHFNISTFYICRIFKEISGFSVNEYLTATRLREAQKQLRETDFSIVQVAENCGFGSISNFGRLFKSSFGVSPLQFRKKI